MIINPNVSFKNSKSIPYGYRLNRLAVDISEKLVIVEDEADVIRYINRLRKQRKTMTQIAEILNNNGFRYRRKRFTRKIVSEILSYRLFHEGGIFMNGLTRWNGTRIFKHPFPRIIEIENGDVIAPISEDELLRASNS